MECFGPLRLWEIFMLRKIRNCLLATLVLGLVIALWRTDWKGANVPASDFQSFGRYLSEDSGYAELFRKHRDTDAFRHPIDKLESYRELKAQELRLRAKYEIKEVPANYVTAMAQYVWFSFKASLLSFGTWARASAIMGAIFGSAVIFRAAVYYAVAPLFTGRRLRLFAEGPDGGDSASGSVRFEDGGRKCLGVRVERGRSLVVVGEDYINGYTESSGLRKRTRWLFSWKYPFMSFFCGLRAMNEYINRGAVPACVDITSDDPNEYFIEIELKNCKGAFIVPSVLKAYTVDNEDPEGGLKLSLAWRPFSITALCLKRVRYYKISGSGRIVLSSFGGFNGYELSEQAHRHKPSSLVFADTALVQTLARTETFYPFLCGRTDLFDLQIEGRGKFVAKNTVSPKRIVDRLASGDAILNGLGKLMGF